MVTEKNYEMKAMGERLEASGKLAEAGEYAPHLLGLRKFGQGGFGGVSLDTQSNLEL